MRGAGAKPVLSSGGFREGERVCQRRRIARKMAHAPGWSSFLSDELPFPNALGRVEDGVGLKANALKKPVVYFAEA